MNRNIDIFRNFIILFALAVMLFFTVIIVLSFINIVILGDEYEITDKCIDNAGFEFKDQYCEGKLKCGPMSFLNNERCNNIDASVAKEEQEAKDVN